MNLRNKLRNFFSYPKSHFTFGVMIGLLIEAIVSAFLLFDFEKIPHFAVRMAGLSLLIDVVGLLGLVFYLILPSVKFKPDRKGVRDLQ